MKKIIGLSAAICLLISVMAGFSAFAVEKTFYDIDFDSWDLNISATTENAADILFDVSDAATTTNGDGWTLSALTGSTKVSAVVAENENAAWTGRGKVLKLEGAPNNLDSNATDGDGNISIKIPFEGYASKNTAYDTDKLILEYDVYIPDQGINEENASTFTKSTFIYCVFGNYAYHDLYHYRKSETFYANSRPLSALVVNEDGTETETHALGAIGDAMKLNTWYHLKFVIDADTKAPYTVGDKAYTGLKTVTLSITDLETNVTTTDSHAIARKYWTEEQILLGGNLRSSGAMEGCYYVDNFKLYKQNKFAFDSSEIDTAVKVPNDKAYFDFKMNANVDEESLSAITLTGAGETIAISAEVLEDGKTVRVNILEDMQYETLYTVDFSGIADSEGRPVETDKQTIEFTTVEAPALYVEETSMFKGVDAFMTSVDELGTNGLYTLAAKVKSSVNESKQATAVMAVYDASGKLVQTTFVTKNIPALAEETIAAGMTFPAALAGGTVKVFLWNNVASLQPYTKPIVANIAAAE